MKLVLFALFTIFSVSSLANDMVITFEDLLVMNRDKQIKTLEMIQEFMVEYEHQQILKGHNPNQSLKQKKKYHVYKKIMQLFIKQAYASDSTPAPDAPCFFAGWPSTINEGSDDKSLVGRKHCDPPSPTEVLRRLRREIPENAERYKDTTNAWYYDVVFFDPSTETFQDIGRTRAESDRKCNTATAMVCNPDVFGMVGEKPLCIPTRQTSRMGGTNDDGGYNSTYGCAKALQEIEKAGNNIPLGLPAGTPNGNQLYQSMMNSALDNLFTGENHTASQSLTMMADICLCGGDTSGAEGHQTFSQPGNNTYAQYAGEIFGSRTCASLLTQMNDLLSHVHTVCNSPDFTANPNNFEGWMNYMNNIRSSLSNDLKAQRESLEKLSSSDQTWSEGDAAYRRRLITEDSQAFADTAQTIYTTAKERKLCPITNAKHRLVLSLIDNPAEGARAGQKAIQAKYIAATARENRQYPKPTLSLIGSNNVELTHLTTTETSGSDTFIINYIFTDPTVSVGADVTAIGNIDGYPVQSNTLPIESGEVEFSLAAQYVAPTGSEAAHILVSFPDCSSGACAQTIPGEYPPIQVSGQTQNNLVLSSASAVTGSSTAGSSGNADIPKGKYKFNVSTFPTAATEVTFKATLMGTAASAKATVPAGPTTVTLQLDKYKLEPVTAGDNNSFNLLGVIKEVKTSMGGTDINLLSEPKFSEVSWKINGSNLASGTEAPTRVSDNEATLKVSDTSQEIKIQAIHDEKESEEQSFPKLEFAGKCSITKEADSFKINFNKEQLGEISNFDPALHLDVTNAKIEIRQNDPSSDNMSAVLDAISFSDIEPAIDTPSESITVAIPEDKKIVASGKRLFFVQGVVVKIAGLSDAQKKMSCEVPVETEDRSIASDEDEETPETCNVKIKKEAIASNFTPKVKFTVENPEEGVTFTWYDMSRNSRDDDEDEDEESSTGTQNTISDDDETSEEDETSEDDDDACNNPSGAQKVYCDNVKYADQASGKRKIGSSSSITVTRKNTNYEVRLVAIKDEKVCGINSDTVEAPQAGQGKPVQQQYSPGFGPTGPKIFRQGMN